MRNIILFIFIIPDFSNASICTRTDVSHKSFIKGTFGIQLHNILHKLPIETAKRPYYDNTVVFDHTSIQNLPDDSLCISAIAIIKFSSP